ncbi:MAG: DDE-type integrase/transposase/recombinase, partial [Thaumarchaeota archaeon]|nr:DDE-type integrase/transposase/recombinase [Nitrososphaerota archaeon]
MWRDKRRGLLKPLPVPERPWADLSADFITGLPPAKGTGATTILVVTDRLSKNVVYEAMIGIKSEETAEALLHAVCRHHGLPKSLVSDRGPQFVSRLWSRLCELLGIERRLSTAFQPETDGSTERANQELERYLRAFATYAQDDWEKLLPAAMMATNNKPSATT